MAIVFGNIAHPAYEKKIVPKPWEGAGFDRVPPRRIVGMCMHKWWGYGDKYALVRLFGTGGERQADALTDYSLTQEGELVMLNEPEGTRSPWANGGSDGLEGDGILFTRTLGTIAINARLVSVEFEGKAEGLTESQLEIGSQLWAYWFDRCKVPWDEYPNNPAVHCVTDMDHYEFATKDCPFAGAKSQRTAFQDRVRGKMKSAQLGGSPEPVPTPNPPDPNHNWLPSGMTPEIVRELFGVGIRIDVDGTETTFGFDINGIISNAWLAQGEKHKMYPSVQFWWRISDPAQVVIRNMVSFSNGWILDGENGNRATWKWRN